MRVPQITLAVCDHVLSCGPQKSKKSVPVDYLVAVTAVGFEDCGIPIPVLLECIRFMDERGDRPPTRPDAYVRRSIQGCLFPAVYPKGFKDIIAFPARGFGHDGAYSASPKYGPTLSVQVMCRLPRSMLPPRKPPRGVIAVLPSNIMAAVQYVKYLDSFVVISRLMTCYLFGQQLVLS